MTQQKRTPDSGEKNMRIEVYGPGCGNCSRLEQNTLAALDSLGMTAEVTKVQDIRAMAGAGVMRTPALGVNGKLVLQGKVPAPPEIAELLRKQDK
jgi:small redox-active disulfide protein 2